MWNSLSFQVSLSWTKVLRLYCGTDDMLGIILRGPWISKSNFPTSWPVVVLPLCYNSVRTCCHVKASLSAGQWELTLLLSCVTAYCDRELKWRAGFPFRFHHSLLNFWYTEKMMRLFVTAVGVIFLITKRAAIQQRIITAATPVPDSFMLKVKQTFFWQKKFLIWCKCKEEKRENYI